MHQLTLTLEPGAPLPMYEQLYRYFAAEIRAGRLRSGEKLPSKRALCAHLNASRSTVETAYGLLLAEGYILSRPRSGYFVAEFAALERVPAAGPGLRPPPGGYGGGARPPYPPAPPDAPPAGTPETGGNTHGNALAGPGAQRPAAPAPPPLRYDFSTAAVDTSLFPYTSWARLYRDTVYSAPELLQQGERQGDGALRQALAAFLGEYRAVACESAQIVVGAGLEYLIGLLLELFPRDTVFGTEDPGYAAFYHAVRGQARPLRLLPLDAEGLSPAALERSDVEVAYITPSHQFPMGVTMPAGRRSRLLHWAAAAPGRYLIEDDYDSEFRYGIRPIPALQGMDGGGRVVYVGTFSRSLAPAIRLAYMVLPPALLERYRALQDHARSTVSRYEQAVMARFLSDGYYARYLRRVGNLYRQRQAALRKALSSLSGAQISGSGGGLHFLVTVPRLSEQALCARAAALGVPLRGLSSYCSACAPLPSTVVLGYGGLSDREIAPAVALLRQAWES